MANEFVETIRAAVAQLDPAADADWTEKGLPNVNRVRDITDDASITRADIQAALPDLTRTSAGEASTNAEEEQATDDTAAETQAGDTQKQAGEAGADNAPAPDSETDQEDAPQGGKAGDVVSEPDMSMGDFMARGLLMSVILRLPNPMRVMADKDMLDDMCAFVDQWELPEERMVAVEMIKSISEARMSEIPSGHYKGRVLAAMDVVRGDLDHIRTGVAPADDQKAAAARLARLTGQAAAPVPGSEMKSALSGASDDQAEAHARLYGGPTDGVRSADE
jgi:hypothetical protein